MELYKNCISKQEEIKKMFSSCLSKESKYQKIIDMGKTLEKVPLEHKTNETIVPGCQSIVYLYSSFHEGKVQFKAESEALISSGLAALLIATYNDESPETILKCPPIFIEELGLIASLSLNRASGFQSIYLRMKQDALKFLLLSQ